MTRITIIAIALAVALGGSALYLQTSTGQTSGENKATKGLSQLTAPNNQSLHGAFITPANWMRTPGGPENYRKLLDALHAAGGNLIILKNIQFGTDHATGNFLKPTGDTVSGFDLVTTTLVYAEQHNMKVVIGLWELSTDQRTAVKSDATSQSELISVSKSYATTIDAKYKEYSSFYGWYLPVEPDTCDPESELSIVQYYQTVGAYCKSLNGKPVFVSPYFDDHPIVNRGLNLCGNERSGRERFLKVVSMILDAGTIDVLLIQDSVGTRLGQFYKNGLLDSDLLQSYFQGAQTKISASGSSTTIGIIVEAFDAVPNKGNSDAQSNEDKSFYPTSPERFSQQLQFACQLQYQHAVIFDWENYLYPHDYTTAISVSTTATARRSNYNRLMDFRRP